MDPHGSLAISPRGRIVKAENEQARKLPAPYAVFQGHPKFAIPSALPWLGHPGGTGDTRSPRGCWEMQVRVSGRLVLLFGGRLEPLGAGKANWGAQTQSWGKRQSSSTQWCGGCRLRMKEEPGPPARWTEETFRSRSHPASSSSHLPTPPSLLTQILVPW